MKKAIYFIIIFIISIVFTFTIIYKNIKIVNIQNGLVTIDILGLEFNYYYEYESEE